MTDYASFSDKELIQMLSLDKEPAFNEIYKRYTPSSAISVTSYQAYTWAATASDYLPVLATFVVK